jgi:RNA polymerase sigma-70 factor (ECF subfamily)
MDDAQYAPLVEPLVPLLIRVAAAFVGFADAEDAAQEALLHAWNAWPKLPASSKIRPWLIRIVINLCHDWQRGRFGTRQRMLSSLSDTDSQLPPALLETELSDSSYDAKLDLRQAISQLDEPLQQIIILRYYVGIDATTIGSALGLPSATVRTRLRRAIMILRKKLILSPSIRISEEGSPDE